MSMMPSLRNAVLAVLITAAAPAAVLAQSSPAPTAPAPSGAGAPAADAAAQARVEARIKQLHADLHITAGQEPQWKAFADTMRSNAHEMDEAAEQRAEQLATMNALQDLKSYEELAEAHVQRLQKLIPPFDALYNAMSPEQKQAADRIFRAGAERHARGSGSSGH